MNQEESLAELTSPDRFRSGNPVYLKVTTEDEILWYRAIKVERATAQEAPWARIEENALVIEGFEIQARLPRRPRPERGLAAESAALEIGEIEIRRRSSVDRQHYFDKHSPALKDRLVAIGALPREVDALLEEMRNDDHRNPLPNQGPSTTPNPEPEVMWGIDPGDPTVATIRDNIHDRSDWKDFDDSIPIKNIPFPHEAIQQAILDISSMEMSATNDDTNDEEMRLKTKASRALISQFPFPQDIGDFSGPSVGGQTAAEAVRRAWGQNTHDHSSIIRPGADQPIVIKDHITDGELVDDPWSEDGGTGTDGEGENHV